MCRSLVLLVLVSVLLPLLPCIAPCAAQERQATARYRGTLKQTVKSDLDSSTDVELTIETLRRTGQNLYGPDAEEIEDFAIATEGTGIDLVPLFGSSDIVNDWDNDIEALAQEFSALSSRYPNIVGFTIDDFHRFVPTPESAGSLGQFTAEEVQAMTDAAASESDLEFWPMIGVYQSPVLLAESHTLGAASGTAFSSEDHATLRLQFDGVRVPSFRSGRQPVLSFLWVDSIEAASLDAEDWQGVLFLEVLVNGVQVACEDLYEVTEEGEGGYKRVRLVEARVGQLLTAGSNEVEIRLISGEDVGASRVKMAHLWDFALEVRGFDLLDSLSPSFTYETSSSDLVASSNEAYRITDSIEGAMTYLASHPSLYPGDAAYRRYLESMERALGEEKTFIMCQTCKVGYDWENVGTVDPDRLSRQTALSLEVADGVVTWNLPIALRHLGSGRGIFAEKTPESGFDLRAYWPSRQPGLHGWFQRWSTTASGTITITLQDSFDRTSSMARFRKRIYSNSTGEVFYEDSEQYDEAVDSDDDAVLSERATRGLDETEGHEEITIELGRLTHELVVEFELIDSIGSLKVTLEVKGPSGMEWVYETGVEENLRLCYQAIIRGYLRHARQSGGLRRRVGSR